MTTTGVIQSLFVGSMATAGSSILYDWETDPTSLVFTGDYYQVFPGVGIGGSNAGGLYALTTGIWNATLNGTYKNYDLWVYAPNLGTPTILCQAYLNGVYVADLFNVTLNTEIWQEFTGSTAGTFNEIRMQAGFVNDFIYMDNWFFST